MHKRLLKEGDSGKMVQENLFDNVWEDTKRRIRVRACIVGRILELTACRQQA